MNQYFLESHLINVKSIVPLPAELFISALSGCVGDLRRKHKPNGTHLPSVLGSRLEKGRRGSAPPCFGSHKQVIQDQDAPHRDGRKAGVQLSEPDGGIALKSQEDHRLIVLEALQQKLPCLFGLTRPAIKLTVQIKQRDKLIQVRHGRLPDLNLSCSHTSLSLLSGPPVIRTIGQEARYYGEMDIETKAENKPPEKPESEMSVSELVDREVAAGRMVLSEMGKRLLEARRRIEQSGIPLLNREELDRERAERRGGYCP